MVNKVEAGKITTVHILNMHSKFWHIPEEKPISTFDFPTAFGKVNPFIIA